MGDNLTGFESLSLRHFYLSAIKLVTLSRPLTFAKTFTEKVFMGGQGFSFSSDEPPAKVVLHVPAILFKALLKSGSLLDQKSTICLPQKFGYHLLPKLLRFPQHSVRVCRVCLLFLVVSRTVVGNL